MTSSTIPGSVSKAELSPGSGTTTCRASPSSLGIGADAGPATPSTSSMRCTASSTAAVSASVTPPWRSHTISAGMSCEPANRVSSSSDFVDSAESGRNAAWSFSMTALSLPDSVPATGKTTNRLTNSTTPGSNARRQWMPRLLVGPEPSCVIAPPLLDVLPLKTTIGATTHRSRTCRWTQDSAATR